MNNINLIFKYIFYNYIIKIILRFPQSKKLLRVINFHTENKSNFVLANTSNGYFAVSAGDLEIGRATYVYSNPYDYDKFSKAVYLLPESFSRINLVDVGANIGTICIPAVRSKLFSAAIAVEPEPINYNLLSANIYLNGLQECITRLNYAASENNFKPLIFELSESNLGDHRVRLNGFIADGHFNESTRKVITVNSMILNDILTDNFSSINTFINIDTQGFEGHVLAGASKVIEREIPLLIEFWPYGLRRVDGYEKLFNCLKKSTYKYLVDMRYYEKILPFNAENLHKISSTLDGNSSTDLLIY